MSKREAIVILLVALVLAALLPMMGHVFAPREAAPEPLPGVPFSTTPKGCRQDHNGIAPCTIAGRVDLQDIEDFENVQISVLSNVGNQPGWSTEGKSKILSDGSFELSINAVDINGSLQVTRFKLVAEYHAFESAEKIISPRSGRRIEVGVLKIQPRCNLTVQIKFMGTWTQGESGPARRVQMFRLDELDSLEGFRSWPHSNYWASGWNKPVEMSPGKPTSVPFGIYSIQIDYTEPGLRFDRRKCPTVLPFEHVFKANRPSLQVDVQESDPVGSCTLSAQVVDGHDQAMANRRCTVCRVGPGPQVRLAAYGETDGRGLLQINSLPSGCYSVSTDWRVPQRYLQLVEGNERTYRLQFEFPGSLCVRLLRKGQPAPDIKVKAGSDYGGSGSTETTNESGVVWFRNLEFPCWLKPLVNGRSGKQPGRFPCDWYIDRQPPPDSPTVIDIEPVGSVALSGRVTFSGNALGGQSGEHEIVEVTCLGIDGYNRQQVADLTLDSTGQFACVGLPRGRYAVRFQKSGGGQIIGPALDVVDLSSAQTRAFTYQRDFAFRSFTCRLDALNKRPVGSRLPVRFVPRSLFDIGETKTAVSAEAIDGSIELKNFICDEYVLLVDVLDKNGQPTTLSGNLSVTKTTEGERTVFLEPQPRQEAAKTSSVTVELVCNGSTGPVSLGAGLLRLYDSSRRLITYRYVDRKGQRLEFGDLEAGSYSMELAMPPDGGITQSFEIAPGRPAFVELEPKLPFVNCLVRIDGIKDLSSLYGTVAEFHSVDAVSPPRQGLCIPIQVDGVPHLYVFSAEKGRAFRVVFPDGTTRALNVPITAGQSGEILMEVSLPG